MASHIGSLAGDNIVQASLLDLALALPSILEIQGPRANGVKQGQWESYGTAYSCMDYWGVKRDLSRGLGEHNSH